MDQIIEVTAQINEFLAPLANNRIYIWGILGVGLFFTIKFGFPQIKRFPLMVKSLFNTHSSDSEGISSFSAAMVSLSGKVGSGNVAGVATAIALGGPGAIFWMWMVALFGMATSCAEAVLSQVYKQKNANDELVGGPAYYIQKCFKPRWRWISKVYAIVMVLTFGLIYVSVQADIIRTTMETAWSLPNSGWLIITATAIATAFLVFGGIHRIARATEWLAPIMVGGFAIFIGVMIITNLEAIPVYFQTVFAYAFGAQAVIGGVAGYTVQEAVNNGVKRGIFSNEAGQGSGAVASGTAAVPHPVQQGMSQAFSTFIDTIVVCTLTSFVIITAGLWDNGGTMVGGELATNSFATLAPQFGAQLLSIFLFFFAFTSILAVIVYGESATRFVKDTKLTVLIYRCLAIFMIFFAPLLSVATGGNIFDIADSVASLLFYINGTTLIILSPIIIKVYKDYFRQLDAGVKVPVFKPKELGIHNTDVWD